MSALGTTQSVCPQCLRRIDAERVQEGERVFLVKTCPDHGQTRTLIWEGLPAFEGWTNRRPFSGPSQTDTAADQGCPYDCGLCPEHHQETCCVLLEVTSRCNLDCPVCFASASAQGEDVPLDQIEGWYRILQQKGGTYNIQLSGGEPTVRGDLPQIIELGRRYGFSFFQLNTNGIRLADRDYVKALKDAGLSCVFLQFDGTDDAVFRVLRGAALLEVKKATIQNCGEAGIGVVLVPTLVPGINDHAIGDILRFAAARIPVVRGVHFQPVSYFGRFPAPPSLDRMTIPSLLAAIEEQSFGTMKRENFLPPGAEHARCSFHGNFLRTADGSLKPRTQVSSSCCSRPGSGNTVLQARDFVARQWAAPGCPETPVSLRLDSMDEFLLRTAQSTLAVSAMFFQDARNLDLERLKDCHIHVMSPAGKLIPFCAYNLTSQSGESLYRARPRGRV